MECFGKLTVLPKYCKSWLGKLTPYLRHPNTEVILDEWKERIMDEVWSVYIYETSGKDCCTNHDATQRGLHYQYSCISEKWFFYQNKTSLFVCNDRAISADKKQLKLLDYSPIQIYSCGLLTSYVLINNWACIQASKNICDHSKWQRHMGGCRSVGNLFQ